MKLDRKVFVALAGVAWADGEVAPEESEALLRAAKACGLAGDDMGAVERALKERAAIDAIADLDLSDDERRFVYAIAAWLARADAVVRPEETSVLAKLGELLGLDEDERAQAYAARIGGDKSVALTELARAIEQSAQEEDEARTTELPLPPGTSGWPLVGETLSFVADPFTFFAARVAKHGAVSRTRIVGRNVVVVAGREAVELWLDSSKLERDGSMFDHIFGLFGGYSLPSLDGDVHRIRKQQVLGGFDRAALQSYLPGLQATIEEAFSGWVGHDEIRWIPELRRLAIAGIARNILGLVDAREVDRLVTDYDAVTTGFGAIPISLPGTRLYSANQARDRLMEFMRREVATRRAEPRDDGFSRILKAKASDGSSIDDEAAALELHHIFLAGYIVFAELAGVVLQLDAHADVRERLEREITEQAASGPIGMSQLAAMPYLSAVVDEVKRITPMLPILFAKAKKSFGFKGHLVPEGWQVSLALAAHHRLTESYPDPERFDPARFSDGRGAELERTHAFVPQGPEPLTGHKCPGTDYASYFMKLFTVVLLRGHRWTLIDREWSYDFKRLPPEPRGGMRARIARNG
jgi:cytochrome P450/uncharacterized tellurite resistance protein B-like protein